MTYKLFFEIYGKKMVVETEASSEAEAKSKVRDAISFHKIEKIDYGQKVEDLLKGFMKKGFGG